MSSPRRHARKAIMGIGIGVLAVVSPACLAFWLLTRSVRDDLRSFSFKPDVEIDLFAESDIDSSPLLYYEVRRAGRLVSPRYVVGAIPDDDRVRRIRKGSSADGSVVALWSPPASEGHHSLLILYHLPSGESWPRLLEAEVASQPAVRLKWRARYALLRQDHGELPSPEEVIW